MIAIYARQSVDKKDSLSIDGQIELCRKECSEEPEVFADRGYSGKNTDRPAFQKMMKAVKRGEVDKIIVYRLDRISRSITDFGAVWDMLKEHGTEFVSVNEKFDTSTPVGRAMVYIIMVFAQLERETIAERIKDNYYQRAKRGVYPGGPAPFGFSVKRTVLGGKAASVLVPNEHIKTVEEIFERYAYSGVSLGSIAALLVKQGITGIGRKTWDNVSISRILHNPVYVKADADVYYFYREKGLVLFNEIDDFTGKKALFIWGRRDRGANKYANLDEQLIALTAHDGIIDSRTFLACQRKLDSNRQLKRTGCGKYTWLSGLVKCDQCGYSLRVIHTRGYLYFYCSGKSNLHLCDAKHTESVREVENEAAAQIQAELDRLADAPEKDEPVDSHNAEKIEVAKIDGQIENLIDRLEESNEITMRYMNQRIAALDSRRSELLNLINTVSNRPRPSVPDVPFAELDFDAKKAIAHMLVSRVEAGPEHVKVIFK
ncbi:recombinase family protein [Caproicibacter fermentans]|uniref:Recombinase family protein n=1 Tax=Caproicibacter fermentans TaxID=2576756 RepID=A0A7G8TE32_9FIRM|nr:recombinase family protein [Caproicibacter fermentans]QNK41873.1 recombinase family protein [Caproicibacter fermentans]